MKKIETGLTSVKRKKIVFLTVLMTLVAVVGISQNKNQKGNQPTNSPAFTNFAYQGNDKVYNDFPLKPDEFYNPILQGCYPDPSITRKGDDYYLVNSSFAIALLKSGSMMLQPTKLSPEPIKLLWMAVLTSRKSRFGLRLHTFTRKTGSIT